jgi:hypothetical protein
MSPTHDFVGEARGEIFNRSRVKARKHIGSTDRRAAITRDKAVPLTVAEWLARDLPQPDRIIGDWLTTTSRALLTAPTGMGKTNLLMAIATHAAARLDFLHWKAHREARVLFIDGEMNRRLLRSRIADVVRRIGLQPPGLHVLSHEDVEDFQPLSTPTGQAIIERVIERVGRVDLVIFDNVMSLVGGDMKDEESWARTLPFVKRLTKRAIGQIWAHHTGHDANKGYGTKTREWQMDTSMLLTDASRPDTDVSFTLTWPKARERTPMNRRDFQEVTIALINDEWISSGKSVKRGKLSPSNKKFLDALVNVFASGATEFFDGRKVARVEHWRAECEKLGLIDRDAKPSSARSWFSKNKRELIERNYIASHHDQYVWNCEPSKPTQAIGGK